MPGRAVLSQTCIRLMQTLFNRTREQTEDIPVRKPRRFQRPPLKRFEIRHFREQIHAEERIQSSLLGYKRSFEKLSQEYSVAFS
jgi:hypothetical protein